MPKVGKYAFEVTVKDIKTEEEMREEGSETSFNNLNKNHSSIL